MKKQGVFLSVIVSVLVLAVGCASTKSDPPLQTQEELTRPGENVSGVTTERPKPVIIDWQNSNVSGIPDTPVWLAPLILGNTTTIKQAFAVDQGDIVKYTGVEDSNRERARIRAGLLFAQKIATELKQHVATTAAQTFDQQQIDVVENITSITEVDVTGMRQIADFWQYVEKTDPTNNAKSRVYVYYIVYGCSNEIYTAVVRKYVNDVIGQLEDRQVQTNIANIYGEIQRKATIQEERSQAEFLQELRLREQAVANLQAQDMAIINQQTVLGQANASVAQSAVDADARARYAAYKYGDAATAAAATTTAADIDWINALSTAADILF